MNVAQPQTDPANLAAADFTDTVLHVLETAVFALADPVEDPTEEAAEVLAPIAVGIDLGGDMRGRMEIAGSFDLFASLAADMMGADLEEITIDQAADFLAELANMIAGRWATDALGDQAEVALGIPQPIPMNQQDWQARLQAPGCHVFAVDEQYLLVNLTSRTAK